MSGYDVTPAELKTHATSFGTLVSRVHQASDAAQSEGVMGGGNPYGILFTPLIFPLLEEVCLASQGFLAGLAKLGDGMEKSLNDNVDIYTEAENSVVGLAKGVFE